MKIRALIILTTIVFFSSCNKEEENNEIDVGRTVTFTVAADSRASQEGNFEEGDAIGIFAYEPRSKQMYYTNCKYVYDGKVFLPATETDNIRVTAGTDFDFYVYYPYDGSEKEVTSISYEIPDQATREGWLAADFMTATYTDPVVDYTIALNFLHRYSTITLTVTENDGINQAKIANIQSKSQFDLMKGTYTTEKTLSTKGMYLYSTDNNKSVFRITVPVQNINENNPITISKNGQESLVMKATESMKLEEGKIHDYRIGYKKTVSITNYDAGGSVSGAGKYAIGSTCKVTASPKSGYTFAGWYEGGQLVWSGAEYSFEVLKDRTLETRYKSYGKWSVSVSANPASLEALGGESTITSSATRTTYINGKESSTETGNPTLALTGNTQGFTLSGNKVSASVNSSNSSRSVTVKATYSDASNTCTITQKGGNLTTGEWVITVSASPETLPAAGGTSTITAKAERDVFVDGEKVSTETGTPSISGSASGFNLAGNKVTAQNNTSTSERSITIYASIDGKRASCMIKQQAGSKTYGNWSNWSIHSFTIAASPTNLPAAGGTSRLTATVDRERSRTIYWNGIIEDSEIERENQDVTSSTSFSGSSSGFTINASSVTASKNTSTSARSIQVTGRYSGWSDNVTVTQDAANISEEYVFELKSGDKFNLIESDGGSFTYTVESYKIRRVNGEETREEVDYTISSNVDWITAGKTSASVKENPDTSMRSGTVTLKQVGSGKTITLTVNQQKKVIIDIG